jgi:hypothetical protein
MIYYLNKYKDIDDPSGQVFPIFLEYAGYPTDSSERNDLHEPHGNAKKITPPFTSTVPSFIANIRMS